MTRVPGNGVIGGAGEKFGMCTSQVYSSMSTGPAALAVTANLTVAFQVVLRPPERSAVTRYGECGSPDSEMMS